MVAGNGAVAVKHFHLAEDGPVSHAGLHCTHNTRTDAGRRPISQVTPRHSPPHPTQPTSCRPFISCPGWTHYKALSQGETEGCLTGETRLRNSSYYVEEEQKSPRAMVLKVGSPTCSVSITSKLVENANSQDSSRVPESETLGVCPS